MGVASDCHGPMCLAQCVKPDGTPLVAGLDVTGFSNAEEDMVGQTSNVPFLIETKFKEQGAKYTAGDPCRPTLRSRASWPPGKTRRAPRSWRRRLSSCSRDGGRQGSRHSTVAAAF